jgi:hypothetical protein
MAIKFYPKWLAVIVGIIIFAYLLSALAVFIGSITAFFTFREQLISNIGFLVGSMIAGALLLWLTIRNFNYIVDN